LALLALDLLLSTRAIAGGTFIEQNKLIAPDADDEDYLGTAVAAWGNYIAAGVPYDWDGSNIGAGSVYLFESNNYIWNKPRKLEPSDGEPEDEFGLSLAMQDEFLFIGAPGHSQRRGAVYVFERRDGVWVQAQKLVASDGSSGHAFGSSISLFGEILAIGAPSASSSRGAVYVFRAGEGIWTQDQKLVAPDSATGDAFGASIAMTEGTLAIGARLDDLIVVGDNRGSVYTFGASGSDFVSTGKLTLSDSRASDEFGASLAFGGSELLVGAPFRDLGTSDDNAGMVYRFRRESGSWALAGSISEPEGTPRAGFGSSIAARASTLLIGAPFANNTTGFALHFEMDNDWILEEKLIALDARPFEYFGRAVAVSEEFAAVSAEFANVGAGLERGAVYAHVRGKTEISITLINPNPAIINESITVSVGASSLFQPPSGDIMVASSDGHECVASISFGLGSCVLPGHSLGTKSLIASYPGAKGLSASAASNEFRVVPALQFSTLLLPKGKISRPYGVQLEVSLGGATPPLRFSRLAGRLPVGLILAEDGLIEGTPLESGRFEFEAQVEDASGESLGGPFVARRAFTLDVDPAFSTSLTLQTGDSTSFRGQPFEFLSDLQVAEPEADSPTGTYRVLVQLDSEALECSAAVTGEGPQSCSIDFGIGALEGQYSVIASFFSAASDYGPSEAISRHTLFRAVDLSVALASDSPLYRPGQQLTYITSVDNLGTDAASAAEFQLLPALGLTEIHWRCAGSACPAQSGTGAIKERLSLGVAESVEFTLRARAPAWAGPLLETSAAVSVAETSFQLDRVPSNNAAQHAARPLMVFSDGFEE
jgi:uncharacterized repeat protein (TIGR01451 family)